MLRELFFTSLFAPQKASRNARTRPGSRCVATKVGLAGRNARQCGRASERMCSPTGAALDCAPSAAQAEASECATTRVQDAVPLCAGDLDEVRLASTIVDCREKAHSAAFLIDLESVRLQYDRFRKSMPLVSPYYAVKCNSDHGVLTHLARLGCGFEVASQSELLLANSILRQFGKRKIERAGGNARVLFSHPVKPVSAIQAALDASTPLLAVAFDSMEELRKIVLVARAARQGKSRSNDAQAPLALMLRIQADATSGTVVGSLNHKFGVSADKVLSVLRECSSAGDVAQLVGVSFHVGTDVLSPLPFVRSLELVRRVFDEARLAGLPPLRFVDIGGGFPATNEALMRAIGRDVSNAVERLFDLTSVRILAEPGKYIVAQSHTLAVEVLLATERDGRFALHLADGVYGSFKDAALLERRFKPVAVFKTCSGKICQMAPHALRERMFDHSNTCTTLLFGPTCDGLDCIAEDSALGAVLDGIETGDWLVFSAMGAYTSALSCAFNGIEPPARYYFGET